MSSVPSTAHSADKIYDAFADEYRSYSATKANYIAAVDRLLVERFRGKVESILDYGAGDGVRGATVFEQLGAKRLYQADISEAMVEKCRALGKADEVWDIKMPGWSDTSVRADLVVCLWNVLGHVPSNAARIKTLTTLRGLLKPGGHVALDVNNRHYEGYGIWQSRWRRFVDWLAPDTSRGDVEFTWTINGVDYPASGHFFTPAEMHNLFEAAGFRVSEALAVDYRDGTVYAALPKGQMFFVAETGD